MDQMLIELTHIPIITGIIAGLAIALVASALMYAIGVPVENIKSRKAGKRPLYVGFNVIAFVMIVVLSITGGVIVNSAKGKDSGVSVYLTELLPQVSDSYELSLQTINVDRAVSTGSEQGVNKTLVALSDVKGNTYKITKYPKGSLDVLESQVVSKVVVACDPLENCSVFSPKTPLKDIVKTMSQQFMFTSYVSESKY